MIKIGVVNIDISHPIAFSEYLKKQKRARYTAVYNDGFRDAQEVSSFISKYNLEKRCDSLENLAECVDVGFIQSCNWDKHIEEAMPFIKAGKPVFLDKPMVGNLRDCEFLESLVASGAKILGSSSVRYAEEIVSFVSKPESERGKILQVYGTAGVDEFNYAIHIVEGIGGLLGTGAKYTQFVGRSASDGKICETFCICFENNVTAVFNTFQGLWQPFDIVIMTTKSTYTFRIDTGKIYGALLDRICNFVEYGRNELAPVPALTESIKIMLACRLSREKNGLKINLSELTTDDPGYDGAKFENEYAATANRRLYSEFVPG